MKNIKNSSLSAKAAKRRCKTIALIFHGKRFLVRGSQPIEERLSKQLCIRTGRTKKSTEESELAATPTGNDPNPYFDQAQGLDDVTKNAIR